MAAILLAALGAVFFGALSVAQRAGLTRARDLEAATVATCVVALALAAVLAAAAGQLDQLGGGDSWPYFVAGLLAPGAGQLLFMYAVRAIGAARSTTLIAAAPLLSAVPAFVILDEPLRPALPVGAVLIITGAVVLSSEQLASGEFRRIGIAFALGSAAMIAARDNLVRAFARDDGVGGLAAATASLAAASLFVAAYVAVVRRRPAIAGLAGVLRAFLPAGLLLGLAYAANLEALTRGRVTVVTPFYGMEALWAVLLAHVFLGRTERIGPRVLVAAGLMVVGAALIGAFR